MKQQELTLLLCIIWALTLLYGEMFAYWVPSLFTCSWPHLLRSSSSNSTVQTDSGAYQVDYVKVAVMADPQLMDKTSLRLPPESFALEIAEFYTDLYMRRSFFASVLPFKPDVILFLGDYFDGGPYLTDEEWKKSFSRFKHIFGLNEQGKYTDMQVYYIPGNHDIGYEYGHSQRPEVIRRYEETFGIRNYQFAIGKVDFIVVDAQMVDGHPEKHLVSQAWEFVKNVSVGHPKEDLVSQSWEFLKNVSVGYPKKNLVSQAWEFVKNVSGGHPKEDLVSQYWEFVKNVSVGYPKKNLVSQAWEFVKNVSGGHLKEHLDSQDMEFLKNVSIDDDVHPRVLLTHIPLYRPDDTYCGPDRSSPVINQRVSRTSFDNEIWYQNYVSGDSSKNLMDMIKPKLILSGHDHDQCTITHLSKFGPIKEHTLGTISWQQGNLYPSFMLLSVSNSTLPNASTPEEALLTHLCFLPMQTHIYIWYMVQFILTLFAVLLWPTNSTSFWHQCWNLVSCSRQLITSALFSGKTKEKDEDANYEYEMMWDAEGSMHLVKKPLNASVVNSRERSLGERGNAVMRPAVRKHTFQEGDISVNMDMASGNGFDPIARISSRTGKSKTTFVIQRLLRTVRMITVISAVNVPLYIMLLFKDWIDK